MYVYINIEFRKRIKGFQSVSLYSWIWFEFSLIKNQPPTVHQDSVMSLFIESNSERCSSINLNIDSNNNQLGSETNSASSSLGSSCSAKHNGLIRSHSAASPFDNSRSKSPINVDALNKLLVLADPNTKLVIKRPESIDVTKENEVTHLGETILTTPMSPSTNAGFESKFFFLWNCPLAVSKFPIYFFKWNFSYSNLKN